ncbi:MAG: pyridoxal-phosphate dependent enzyme, partial [Deltaproteobacteria bacterium]
MRRHIVQDLPQIGWDLSSPKQSIVDMVGNTPLIKINRITKHLPGSVEVYAKLESYNPGGSVKDRAA